MENSNHSYNSYPDSHDSSPRSREIDCENASWDEPQLNYKVRFMCSYGGKILPRPHDNQLTYVGGDTKILTVDRNIKFSGMISKLSSISDFDVCFKYQLPGEDLDALISVTNDEDLEHMMIEYDRLLRGSIKPARLRLFLFSLMTIPSSPTSNVSTDETKSNQQWFVDALNSVPIHSLDVTSPPSTVSNPDFLFGFDHKGQVQLQSNSPLMVKQQEQVQVQESSVILEKSDPKKNMSAGSDHGKDDRQIGIETAVSRVEIERQIHDLQRLQISNHEQAMFQRQTDEMLARAFPGEYYMQKVPDKPTAMATAAAPIPAPVQTVPAPTNISAPTGYLQERHVATGGYPIPITGVEQQHQPPMYMYPTPTSMYPARPVTGQVGQGYPGIQRMMPGVYREQPVYGMAPPQPQPTKIVGGGYGESGGINIVRQQQPPGPPPPSGIPVGESGGYNAQLAYDSTGRQVFYTTTPGPGVGVAPTFYHNVPVDSRQTGQLNQAEGNKILKSSQPRI